MDNEQYQMRVQKKKKAENAQRSKCGSGRESKPTLTE